jgi:hypothetical protein
LNISVSFHSGWAGYRPVVLPKSHFNDTESSDMISALC